MKARADALGHDLSTSDRSTRPGADADCNRSTNTRARASQHRRRLEPSRTPRERPLTANEAAAAAAHNWVSGPAVGFSGAAKIGTRCMTIGNVADAWGCWRTFCKANFLSYLRSASCSTFRGGASQRNGVAGDLGRFKFDRKHPTRIMSASTARFSPGLLGHVAQAKSGTFIRARVPASGDVPGSAGGEGALLRTGASSQRDHRDAPRQKQPPKTTSTHHPAWTWPAKSVETVHNCWRAGVRDHPL